MQNIKTIKASLVVVGAFFSMAAGAASFDCAKASSRVENAICASSTLSRLDSELADAYGVTLLTNADAEGVKSAQRVWLRDTRNKCVDDACLETVYKQRIAALRGPDPVDAPSRAEIEADDANMPSDQELAEQEQKRLAEEQAAKARADELSAKAQADVAAKAKAEAEAAELAKKQKEEAETKKAVQAKQQQLYIAIGVGVLLAIGFFSWLLLGKRKTNPSTVRDNKASPRNDPATQGDVQEAVRRAREELLHKQQADIEALKAKLAREAKIVSNGTSTQAASMQGIQGTYSNEEGPQDKSNPKNESSDTELKHERLKKMDASFKGERANLSEKKEILRHADIDQIKNIKKENEVINSNQLKKIKNWVIKFSREIFPNEKKRLIFSLIVFILALIVAKLIGDGDVENFIIFLAIPCPLYLLLRFNLGKYNITALSLRFWGLFFISYFFVLVFMLGSSEESRVVALCEEKISNDFMKRYEIEKDHFGSYNFFVPNPSGSRVAVVQLNFKKSKVLSDSMMIIKGKFYDVDSNLGWHIWRCTINKDEEKVEDYYKIDKFHAEQLLEYKKK